MKGLQASSQWKLPLWYKHWINSAHVHSMSMYEPCMYNVCTMYVHGITSCLNRFSWSTERCRCRTEGHPSALCFSGRYGWRQSLSRRWWLFWCQVRCWRYRGGHQQVSRRLGEPGGSWFWQAAFIAQQAKAKLPVPVAAHGSNMSHAEALEGGFLPRNSRSGLRLLSSYCTGTQ